MVECSFVFLQCRPQIGRGLSSVGVGGGQCGEKHSVLGEEVEVAGGKVLEGSIKS